MIAGGRSIESIFSTEYTLQQRVKYSMLQSVSGECEYSPHIVHGPDMKTLPP